MSTISVCMLHSSINRGDCIPHGYSDGMLHHGRIGDRSVHHGRDLQTSPSRFQCLLRDSVGCCNDSSVGHIVITLEEATIW
jgi:hypothetical protein